MEERVGFIGLVLEEMAQAGRVNEIIGQYQDMVTGRIGVPDHDRGTAVIGLLVRGDNARLGSLTGRLGNVPGVSVKSALTAEKKQERQKNNEKIL